jgi:hypothetical protein
MYNLVTDVVGGVEVVVLEESLAPLSVATAAPARRFAPATPATASPGNGKPEPALADEPTEETTPAIR